MQTIQTKTPAKAPLISFIVTTYDLPIGMLRDCLDSIKALSLSKEEREILLIDDGSKESPIGELMNYLDDIIYLRQPNRGLSAARNKGIQCCCGTYIQFVDGDDMLNSSAYEHCLDIVRYQAPDIVMFRHTDKRAPLPTQDVEGPMSGSEYMRHNNLRAVAWGYIFKKDILLNLRFTEGILHEDEEFTPLLFLRAERLFTTEAQAYYYRKRSSSIVNKKDKRWITQRLNDTRDVLFRLQERCDTLPMADREALQRRVNQLTMDYLYNVMTLTHSIEHLEKAIVPLHDRGLFPLPDKDYTTKYSLFRRMVNSQRGRRLLCRLLK